MEKVLSQIEKYVLYAVLFLLPIAVIGISPNPFVVPKLAVISGGVLIILLIRCVKILSSGKLDFNVGIFDLQVFLIALAYLLSTMFRTPNKMEALLLPGSATVVIGGALLYFLLNQLKIGDKKTAANALFWSSVAYSFITLVTFSGIVSKIELLPQLLRTQGFTPEGGYLPSAIFLVTILPLCIDIFISEKITVKKSLLGVATTLVGLGAIVSIFNLLPGQKFTPKFPSYSSSWAIAIDSLKESPIFGVGPGNYLTAFNRFRPLGYNTTDLWAVKFATARSFFLTLTTEAGLLATAGFILLVYAIYKAARRDLKEQKLVNWGFAAFANLASLVFLSIALLLFPATILITALFFIYLALYTKTKQTTLPLTSQGIEENSAGSMVASRFPALLITLPVLAGVIFATFRMGKILVAEYQYKVSLDALLSNNATKTYDSMRQAIKTNPFVDRYHTSFARINLALANAVAQKANSSVSETESTETVGTISEADRTTISQLIQQAINEGKSTVALNPLRAGSWEILASVYQAISPLAQGADSFAIQSYRQAIALDPFNPNLRIALGGIYYSGKDYDNAIKSFENAVAAKKDHANARFNLSFALREAGLIDRAIQEMTVVLSLIQDKSSQDYEVARKALENMQAKKASGSQGGEQLTPPQEAQEPVLEPPIDLPEGSEPPEAPLSPTPTLSPEQAEEISVTPSLSPTVTSPPSQ